MTLDRDFVSSSLPTGTEWDRRIGHIDGVPFYENEYDFLINNRDVDDYQQIKSWVDTELMPYMTLKSINERHSSYGLKHVAERDVGFYVSNGDIKLALLENGVPFKAYPGSPNISYPISQKFYRRHRWNP